MGYMPSYTTISLFSELPGVIYRLDQVGLEDLGADLDSEDGWNLNIYDQCTTNLPGRSPLPYY
jgi:hypothetical protein